MFVYIHVCGDLYTPLGHLSGPCVLNIFRVTTQTERQLPTSVRYTSGVLNHGLWNLVNFESIHIVPFHEHMRQLPIKSTSSSNVRVFFPTARCTLMTETRRTGLSAPQCSLEGIRGTTYLGLKLLVETHREDVGEIARECRVHPISLSSKGPRAQASRRCRRCR